MDYLKFNCYDFAARSAELHEIYRAAQSSSDELTRIFSALDPQIKSYEGINKQITDAKTAAAEAAARILSMTNALNQTIDVYYSAENNVMKKVEELPTGAQFRSGASNPFNSFAPAPIVSTSTINGADLILEDWLAELIVKQTRG